MSTSPKDGAEDTARETLLSFFCNEGWFSRPSRQSHVAVLNVLKDFPGLISTRFQVRYPNNRLIRATPLMLLVESKAELDIVQATYELNPSVLSKDFDLIYILRRACQYRAPAAVVEFLGLKFPKALADSHYKQIALSYALRHSPNQGRSSLKTIQTLLKLCPKSVHYVNNVHEHGDNALGLAILNGYGLDVVRLILDVMKRQNCDLASFGIPNRWNLTLDSQAAKSIDLILSRSLTGAKSLASFECRPSEWTEEGFTELMDCLAARKASISSIQLDIPNGATGSSEERIRDGLRNLCSGLSSVEELELDVKNTPPSWIDAALRGLDHEDGHHQSLRKLILQDAQDLDLRALCAFLASESAPTEVQINSCRIHGRPQTTPASQSNKIQSLEIKDCFLSCNGRSSLLVLVTDLPKLKELTLVAPADFSDSAGTSDPELPVESLVDLMRNNTIETLQIVAYALDEDLFYDSFLENTSLKKYRYTNKRGYAPSRVNRVFRRHNQLLAIAMEYGNVTLIDPYIGDIINEPGGASTNSSVKESKSLSKIDYFATLNSFGRGTARDPTETAETIVKLLCEVVDPYSCFPCLDPSRKLNLQYGLLRESLSIWSSAHMPDFEIAKH